MKMNCNHSYSLVMYIVLLYIIMSIIYLECIYGIKNSIFMSISPE